MLLLYAHPCRAQSAITADTLTEAHVRAAIDAIVDDLYQRKHATRFWDPEKAPPGTSTKQGGGYTALTVLALLYAGQSYQDPRLHDAIDYLAAYEMEGTYAVSLRCAVWAKLPPKFEPNLRKDAQWLLDGFSTTAAGWTYEQQPNTTRRDNSITQYGALALWEAAQRGVEIDRRLWQMLEKRFIDMQMPDGGWNYTGREGDNFAGPSTGSMTAAGLATLFIIQDLLHAHEDVNLRQRGGDPAYKQAMQRGMQWMDDRFRADDNPGASRYLYYYLYGVERVGLASGYKSFGARDWFREGAAVVINQLCEWDPATQTMRVHKRIGGRGNSSYITVRHLSFALMFLCRGQSPVAFNKLRLDGARWDNRPRDVANLAAWLTRQTERELTWQIVDLDDGPERWLDAPLLYLASDEPLPFIRDLDVDARAFVREARRFIAQRAAGELPMDATPPQRPDVPELDRLKRYLDRGGMLLACAEGSGKAFARSVETAGSLMYPQYDWEPLPDDHPAFNLYEEVNGRRPRLKRLSNGVRDLIILASSGDLPRTFQSGDAKRIHEVHTVANLYFQRSEMNRARPRIAAHGESLPHDLGRDGSIRIVRALHIGNWKPEPLALPMLAAHLRAQHGIEIDISDAPLGALHTLDPTPALVWLSGIDAPTFTEAQLDSMQQYVNRGGTILVETPGGRGVFAEKAEEALAALFNRPITLLRDYPIITGVGLAGGEDCTTVRYRPFALQTFGALETKPRLRCLLLDDRPAVIFSRDDFSHALLDQPCWGISGYTRDAAAQLLGNLVQVCAKATATN
jgi:hypothetical protein